MNNKEIINFLLKNKIAFYYVIKNNEEEYIKIFNINDSDTLRFLSSNYNCVLFNGKLRIYWS